jgi:NAD dependent epimerase/dehydratase
MIGITGAEGFIGSHVVEKFLSQGHKVRALVQYNSNSHLGWLDQNEILSNSNFEVVFGDVRDSESLAAFGKGLSRVAHLAALIAIPYSYRAPQSYIDTNISGTLNVLKMAQNFGIARTVITSTSEVYGSAQFVPMDETHPLVGQSPYAASKIGSDQIGIAFANSFGLNVSVIRPFNTFGPRQSLRAVIPTIIGQVLAKPSSIQLGRIDTTRDYTYVKDTAEAFYSMVMSDEGSGQVFNFGSGFEISIRQIVDLVQQACGTNIEILEDVKRLRPEESEVLRLYSNPEKFFRSFKYESARPSRESFSSKLEQTIDWFKVNRKLLGDFAAAEYRT